MRFNHDEYGFKLEELPKKSGEDRLGKLVFKLSNISEIDDETIEILGLQEITGMEELLEEIKKSCDRCIKKIEKLK